MSKSFSKIKKELEKEWIAESVKGQVSYQITKFRKSHDQRGIVQIFLNGELAHSMSDLETEINSFGDYFYADRVDETMFYFRLNQGYIHTISFYQSYEEYTSNSTEQNIHSKNALIRLFTIFDRRIGKRRYKELKDVLIGEANWLLPFYAFRYQAEYQMPVENKYYSVRRYKMAKKNISPHFGADNIDVNGWIYNPVHMEYTMDEWKMGWQNDFYLDTRDSFLLVNVKLGEVEGMIYEQGEQYNNKAQIDYVFITLTEQTLEQGRHEIVKRATTLIQEFLINE